MKAAALIAPKEFSFIDIAPPEPRGDEVLVRVKCAGICGSDLHFYETGRIGDVYLREPFVMGHEFMGVIADTMGVQNAPPVGTRVAVDPAVSCNRCEFCRAGRQNICPDIRFTGFPPYIGAFTEFIKIPAENVFPMPDNIPDEAGPVLETLAVAIHALELMPDIRGKTCAVLGAGTVGLLTLILLVHHGAQVVLISEPIAERREMAKKLGCPHVFHPRDKEAIAAHLKKVTSFGPEFVFEAAGEIDSFQSAFDITRYGGEISLIGIYPQGRMELDFTNMRRKELRTVYVRRSLPSNYPESIRLVGERHIDISPLLTHKFPLARIHDAFKLVSKRKDGVIKAVLEI